MAIPGINFEAVEWREVLSTDEAKKRLAEAVSAYPSIEPLTLSEKRAAYMNLSRRSRSDLLNRSALSAVTGG